MGLLPRDFIVRHRLMPLRLDDNGNLVLAMTNPLDVISIDEVSMRTGKRVVPVICTESGFDEAVGTYFSMRGKLKDSRDEGGDEARERRRAASTRTSSRSSTQLLADATAMDASDIHLEPREDSLLVRCRIDGVLHELRDFPKDLQAGIISRLKIMGNMNIAERRLPQDGRTSFELGSGEAVDVRMASIPSLYGENITLRILEVSPLPPTLGSLGPQRDDARALREGPQGARGRHRHLRPDRLRQVDDAVHHARAHQVAGAQDLHRRGPDRTQDRGHRADRGQAADRPDLRPGAALAGARRPGRDHGRRDPRPRDGQDGRRRGDHRPPRVQHAAHQRRQLGRQPARRDGRAALPGRRRLALLRRPAPRATPVPPLPRGRDDDRRALGRARPRRGAPAEDQGLQPRRLPASASAPATAAASACTRSWSSTTTCAS